MLGLRGCSQLALPPGSPAGGPLCRRMIEHMTVRGFAPRTQTGYIRAVRDFTAFFGRPPGQAGAEDLRRYQLHMRSIGASATSMNAAVSALRFFFTVTLGRGDAQVGTMTVRGPRRLPVVLSPEEVRRLLDAAQSSSPGGLKYRAALSPQPGGHNCTPFHNGLGGKIGMCPHSIVCIPARLLLYFFDIIGIDSYFSRQVLYLYYGFTFVSIYD